MLRPPARTHSVSPSCRNDDQQEYYSYGASEAKRVRNDAEDYDQAKPKSTHLFAMLHHGSHNANCVPVLLPAAISRVRSLSHRPQPVGLVIANPQSLIPNPFPYVHNWRSSVR